MPKPTIASKKPSQGKRAGRKGTARIPVWVPAGIVVLVLLAVWVIIRTSRPKALDEQETIGPDPTIPRGVTAEGLPYLGSPEALLVVREYEDFGCHNCRDIFVDVEPDLFANEVASGRVQFVSYPVAFVNSQSLPGAEAAACAQEQSKFWEYRHLLFANQGVNPFTRSNLVEFARVSGLAVGPFTQCLDQQRYQAQVIEQTKAAQRFGITATPIFEIGGERFEGVRPYDSLDRLNPGIKQLIEQALAGR